MQVVLAVDFLPGYKSRILGRNDVFCTTAPLRERHRDNSGILNEIFVTTLPLR
jgi:hypothetical protein